MGKQRSLDIGKIYLQKNNPHNGETTRYFFNISFGIKNNPHNGETTC